MSSEIEIKVVDDKHRTLVVTKHTEDVYEVGVGEYDHGYNTVTIDAEETLALEAALVHLRSL